MPDLAKVETKFSPGKIVAVDTETTGLHVFNGDAPFAVSMCNWDGDTWYCEGVVDPFTRDVAIAGDDWEFVRSIIEDPNITKVFHNALFDVRMLEVAWGLKFKGRLEETLYAAKCCNSLETNYTLKHLAEKYCGVDRADNDALLDMVRKLRNNARSLGWKVHKDVYADYWLPKAFYPESDVCETYAVLDAVRTMMLWRMYEDAMEGMDMRAFYEKEMDLWPCTYDMGVRGVRVDLQRCLDEKKRNEEIMADAKRQMFDLAGYELNVNSSAQLVKICEQRGIKPTEFTASGAPSMSFNSIRTIADDPFLHQLQRYRACSKVCNTFLDKYIWHAQPDKLNPGGFCLHPMFNQAGSQTGRYSCSHPNLQQVVNANGARNAVESMSARMAFGPRPGYRWYHFDYSQLELYLFAGAADEKFMLKHMMEGNDLHAECANRAWGGKDNYAALIKGAVALEVEADHPTTKLVQAVWDEYGWDPKHALDRQAKNEFTAWWLSTYGGDNWDIVKAEAKLGKKVARTRAKFVMYAKIYGGGPKAIKNFLYCSDEDAKAFQLEYDTAFPRIKQYLKSLMREAERNGFVTNAYGRRVMIPPDYAYKCVNYLIQSAAADLLKDSMRKCYQFLKECMVDWHLLMTIHDELVFEIPVDADEDICEITRTNKAGIAKITYEIVNPHSDLVLGLIAIRDMMEDHGGRFSVPIPVECDRCDSRWDVKTHVNLPKGRY